MLIVYSIAGTSMVLILYLIVSLRLLWLFLSL